MKLMTRSSILVMLLLGSLALAATDPSPQESGDPPSEPDAESAPVAGEGAGSAPATEPAGFRAFAESLEMDAFACDPARINAAVDLDSMVDHGLDGLGISDETVADFKTGVRSSLALGGLVCTVVDTGGEYRLLRERRIDGRARALYRLAGDAGLNYLDFRFDERDGAYVADDVYVFTNGAWLSETARRAAIPLAAHENRSLVDRLTGRESAYVQHLPTLQRTLELNGSGRHDEALEQFMTFPEDLRNDRNFLMIRMSIASSIGGDAYTEALGAIATQFGDDPTMALVLLDHYVLGEDFEAAHGALDSLDERVGGDPYLDVLRSGIWFSAGDSERARATARSALERDASLLDARWSLIGIELAAQNHEATAQALDEIVEAGVVLEGLEGIPEYAAFVGSDAGKEWLERNPEAR